MKKIDIATIRANIESEDFAEAKKCQHLLYDESGGPALWHRCFCDYAPKSRNMPQSCNLVWRGTCLKTKELEND